MQYQGRYCCPEDCPPIFVGYPDRTQAAGHIASAAIRKVSWRQSGNMDISSDHGSKSSSRKGLKLGSEIVLLSKHGKFHLGDIGMATLLKTDIFLSFGISALAFPVP
jgi:hypothetical protein